MNQVIYVCPWCEEHIDTTHHAPSDYESCPHCRAWFSCLHPEVIDLGAYI